MIKEPVFIDANIIIHAASFRQADVFDWINSLYGQVLIHVEVLNELKISSVRQRVDAFIQDGEWMLFDPESETSIATDELYDLYLVYMMEVRHAFQQLDEKKVMEGRPLKHTSDLGEIHSLAAARLISAGLICSDDADIREVIKDAELYIVNQDGEETLIQQHTLMDFCIHLRRYEVVRRSEIRKFFKSIRPRDMNLLDQYPDER
ncbi:hypothetical protein [Exiguobacterium sp. s22]|uniref:hypothetical protein n=1 Tax=Exiguobacterium sp. s22 TaxID=2751272 RepID=UPI001BE667D3|nr:hypothetical protein [Exiguobacterium sp. s22]